MTHFVFNDGGRASAGFKGKTGDCVTRAITIATGKPYQEVYDALNRAATTERPRYRTVRVTDPLTLAFIEHRPWRRSKRGIYIKEQRKRSSARTGVYKQTIRRYMESIGWRWTPTMAIGSGCKVHLRADELPRGRLVVSVSKHIVAVINGVIHDTHDCSRSGTRCVYGYWSAP